jgi:hypothetical protein
MTDCGLFARADQGLVAVAQLSLNTDDRTSALAVGGFRRLVAGCNRDTNDCIVSAVEIFGGYLPGFALIVVVAGKLCGRSIQAGLREPCCLEALQGQTSGASFGGRAREPPGHKQRSQGQKDEQNE